MAETNENKSQQLALLLSAQIVHELKALPRGKAPPEALMLLEIAYKHATGVEDLLKMAHKIMGAR
jgi:hypothetical protein